MLPLLLGILLFLGVHLVPTAPELRGGLAKRFGENVYKGIFALVSLAGLVLIVVGYHKLQLMPGKNPVIWDPPAGMRHVAHGLMLLSFIALVASQIPSRIRSWLKHPMLVAIKLWALAHLLVNGDLGSMVLFGSFLAFAVYDRISVKRRGALGPLGARTGGLGADLLVVAIALALYGLMFVYGHEWLIGVPVANVRFAP
jgi:uncharacterized membrane protein